MPFAMDSGIAHRAAIGLMVLATDQTIEHEWRQIMRDLDGVALYQSRIGNDARITPETLLQMESGLADSAALIMPGLPLAVVAFGCTSAAMVIGEERVFARLREARPGPRALRPSPPPSRLQGLGARRIAVLTPYPDVNGVLRYFVQDRGFKVPVLGSFNDENDYDAARIDVASVRTAAIELGDPAVDAVFVCCTSIASPSGGRYRGPARQAGDLQQPRDGMARAAPRRHRRPMPQWGRLFTV